MLISRESVCKIEFLCVATLVVVEVLFFDINTHDAALAHAQRPGTERRVPFGRRAVPTHSAPLPEAVRGGTPPPPVTV